MSLLTHHGKSSCAAVDDYNDDGDLVTIEINLKGLTMGILNTRMGDIHYHLQRHTVGVFDNISSLLRHVARAVAYYHEHDAPIDD